MTNQLSNRQAWVSNRENNHKYIYKQAIKRGYTHLFTSPKITFSKKYKKNIFGNSKFIDLLCVLAIDKIYLVD